MKLKKPSLTKGGMWVGAGLVVGAGIGTGVGFLVLSLNKNYVKMPSWPDKVWDSDNVENNGVQINVSEQALDGKDGYTSVFGSEINTIKDSSGRDVSEADLGRRTLLFKIRTRLGYGPEVAQIKGIRITDVGEWDEANGVYFGASNEIFIKSGNILDSLKNAENSIGKFSPSQRIEWVAEYIFQIIAHEYNHHMAYTYLNSRFKETGNNRFFMEDPIGVDSISYDKDNNRTSQKDQELWDADFYKTFVSELNYDGHDKNLDNILKAKYNNWSSMDNFVSSNGITYYPITKQFSSQQIFNWSNDVKAEDALKDWNTSPTQKYAFYGRDQNGRPGQPAVGFEKEELVYQYSLAELYARKIQQIMMPLATNFSPLASGEKYPIKDYQGPIDGSQELSLFGVDQIVYGGTADGSMRGIYSPFMLDTKNYANETESVPFASDFLYNGNYDASNPKYSERAYAIYDEILNEMGYAGKNVFNSNGQHVAPDATNNLDPSADISKIWWENDSTINPDGSFQPPAATSMFKMGGYVSDNSIDSIGYLDENNNFVKLADVSLSNFTYAVKKELTANSKDYEHIKNDDKYFWVMKNYANINNFLGKDLVFHASINEENRRKMLNTANDNLKDEIAKGINYVDENGKAISPTTWTLETMPTQEIIPLTSYNSEATTWLSEDSEGQRNGINASIARPTYDSSTHGIRIEVK